MVRGRDWEYLRTFAYEVESGRQHENLLAKRCLRLVSSECPGTSVKVDGMLCSFFVYSSAQLSSVAPLHPYALRLEYLKYTEAHVQLRESCESSTLF